MCNFHFPWKFLLDIAFLPSVGYNIDKQGIVKVSTGALQLEKLSAGDASNRESKYKR